MEKLESPVKMQWINYGPCFKCNYTYILGGAGTWIFLHSGARNGALAHEAHSAVRRGGV